MKLVADYPWSKTSVMMLMLYLSLCHYSASVAEQSNEGPGVVDRITVPDAEALSTARKLVVDLYGADITKARTPEDRSTIVKQLLLVAVDSKSDPVGRYALLTVCYDIVAQSGDYLTGSEVIALLDLYKVDGLQLKSDLLRASCRLVKDVESARLLQPEVNKLIDAANANDRYDLSVQLAKSLSTMGNVTRDVEIARAGMVRSSEIGEIRAAHSIAQGAMEKLFTNPDDAQANYTVGRFLCFFKGDWNRGLSLLARGSDADLKGLSELERTTIPGSKGQLELANAWWAWGVKERGVARQHIESHSADLYRQLLPTLSGLDKASVEKRLANIVVPAQKIVASDRNLKEEEVVLPKGQNKDGIQAKLFASSSIGADVYLNGEMVIRNAYREVAGTASVSLKKGDVISVHCSPRFEITSFWMNAQTPDGDFLFGTSRKWYGYLPDDKEKWWIPSKKLSQRKQAIEVEDRREYTDLVKKVAISIPDAVLSQPIASELLPSERVGSYLFYIVSDDDLKPKRKPKREEEVVLPKGQNKDGIQAKLFASSTVGADVYLNGELVIRNAYREVAGTASVSLKKGDVISVRCGSRFDIASFWMNAQTPDGDFLFGTSRKWYGYMPDDAEKWWIPSKKMSRRKQAVDVQYQREYTDLVKKVAESIPDVVLSQQIASEVSPGDNTGGYLFYIVDDDDLKPKKKPKR